MDESQLQAEIEKVTAQLQNKGQKQREVDYTSKTKQKEQTITKKRDVKAEYK